MRPPLLLPLPPVPGDSWPHSVSGIGSALGRLDPVRGVFTGPAFSIRHSVSGVRPPHQPTSPLGNEPGLSNEGSGGRRVAASTKFRYMCTSAKARTMAETEKGYTCKTDVSAGSSCSERAAMGRRGGITTMGNAINRPPSRSLGRYAVAIAALLLVIVAGAVSATVGSAGAAGAAPVWKVQASFLAPPNPQAISCATASDCVAVGNDSIITSTDGGALWSNQAVPAGVTDLFGISCASSSNCLATGFGDSAGMVISTTDGGTAWTVEAVPSVEAYQGVSCVSTLDCVAVGYNGGNMFGQGASSVVISTTDGGTTWTNQTLPNNSYALTGISCASTSHCVAVGNVVASGGEGGVILVTTDGGANWKFGSGVAGAPTLASISCPSTADCIAVGETVIASSDGGMTWTEQSIPNGTGEFLGVSCTSIADCMAVSTQVITTTDGGGSWTNLPVPTGIFELLAVSCGSNNDCEAVARGSVVTTVDDGTTWATPALPTGANNLTGVSCASSTDCVAVDANIPIDGGAVVATTDGGTSWSAPLQPNGIGGLNSISCPSISDCVAVDGGTPPVITTTDGGSTWTDRPIPGEVGLLAVSCATTSTCIGVRGPDIEATTDGGATWTTQTVPAGIEVAGVFCASSTHCVAVGQLHSQLGGDVITTTDGGSTWTSQKIPTGFYSFTAVSCSSTADCAAVGDYTAGASAGAGAVITTTNGGASWKNQVLPTGSGKLDGISCPSSSNCVAVGQNSLSGDGMVIGTRNGGATWTMQAVPNVVSNLAAVSCPSNSSCVAVGGASIFGSDDPFGTATTTLASVNPVSTGPGSPVIYSAVVAPTSGSGTPTGTVSFSIGTTKMCTATLSGGSGSCVSSKAPLGADMVVANYSGDSIFAPSQGETLLTVSVVPSLQITTTSLPPATIGVLYSHQLSASGGTLPFKWKRVLALPKGLKLSSTGLLAGTISTKVPPGEYPISVRVTDSTKRSKKTASADLMLSISSP